MNTAQWGAIFDFDGVIVNSEASHEVCWHKVADRLNLPLRREDFLSGFGLKNERFIKEILSWTQDDAQVAAIIAEKESYFQELVYANPLPLVLGVRSCIEALYERGIPCVIGSSSILKNIEIVLDSVGLRRYFPLIVSGEDVVSGKPNPEVFIRCAKKIPLAPERCVVFEDAFAGIEAAKSANMKAVAVTTTFSKEKFLDKQYQPDSIIPDFGGLDLDAIASLFS